jgi:hypothetical protein
VYAYKPYANYARLAYSAHPDDSYAAAYGYDPYTAAYDFNPYAAPQQSPLDPQSYVDSNNYPHALLAMPEDPHVWIYSHGPTAVAAYVYHSYLLASYAYNYYVRAAIPYYRCLLAAWVYDQCRFADAYDSHAGLCAATHNDYEADSTACMSDPPPTSSRYDPYAPAMEGLDPYQSASRSSPRIVKEAVASSAPMNITATVRNAASPSNMTTNS